MKNHIARNHACSGLRVYWKIVPDVKDLSHSQARHQQTSSRLHPWIAGHAAFRAGESHRKARGIIAEPPVHLVEGPGVVSSGNGATRGLAMIPIKRGTSTTFALFRRLPFQRKPLRLGDLVGGHGFGYEISVLKRIAVAAGSGQTGPHVRLNIVPRHAVASGVQSAKI